MKGAFDIMDRLEVGKIVNTHGLKGEVKIVTWTDYPEVFEDIPLVYAKRKKEEIKLTLKNIKYQKNNMYYFLPFLLSGIL